MLRQARSGTDVGSVRRALWWAEFKANGVKRKNGKFLDLWERRMQNKIFKSLTAQRNYVIASLDRIPAFKNTKGVRMVSKKDSINSLNEIVNGMPNKQDMVNAISNGASIVMMKGADSSISKLKLATIGINFNLKMKPAIDYLSALENLHLSNYQGSISKVTNDGVIQILSDGMDEGLSYTQMASKIRDLSDEGIFSYARAQRIAVDQVGKAYQFGAKVPVQEYQQRTSTTVYKHWIAEADACDICLPNVDDGYITMDDTFSSGDDEPPGHVNCRCDVGYETEDNVPEDNSDPSDPSNNQDITDGEGGDNIQNTLELQDGTTISVPDGYLYHATPSDNLDSIAADGLTPQVAKLDESGTPEGSARVYLGTNPGVIGSGLTMDREGTTTLRVPAGEVDEAHRDPHIPGSLSVYTTNDIPADVVQVQDETGHWVPLTDQVGK